MLNTINALDQVCKAYSKNHPLPDHLRDWVAGSIEKFLDNDCSDLNAAFGIQQGRGGIPWWREKAIRERNIAICELAEKYFSNQKPAMRARNIHILMERYETTSWPRDRQKVEMPGQYKGTPRELIWRAFRSGAKMPVSERHLRNLIGPTR